MAVPIALFYAAIFLFIGVHLPFWPVWLNEHGVAARMRVIRVDHSCGITHDFHTHAGFGISEQILAEQIAADPFIETFFPRHLIRVDRDEFGSRHGSTFFCGLLAGMDLPQTPLSCRCFTAFNRSQPRVARAIDQQRTATDLRLPC